MADECASKWNVCTLVICIGCNNTVVCLAVSYSTTLLSCFDTCVCLLQVVGPRAVELDHLVEEMTEFYKQEANRKCHALKEVH